MAENTQVENTEVKDETQVNTEAQAGAGAPAADATKDTQGVKKTTKAAGKKATAKAGAPAADGEAKAAAKPKGKVYKFVADNKFLTCASLGVQFVNGKAETESLEVAKALATLSGVTLVEE